MDKDQKLINCLKKGNKDALDTIYVQYKNEFLLYARQFSMHEEDLKDIYQDSIIILYENVRSGKLTELSSSLKTYLFAIGKYKIYSQLNKLKVTVEVSSPPEPYEEMEVFPVELSQQRQKQLQQAYGQLGKKCRQLLRLFYYESQSIDSIKTTLHYSSKDVVKSLKHRCLKQLKELIRNKM